MSEPFSLARYTGFTLAWADGWPGLVAGAGTDSGLAERIPLALAEHRAWLNAHGVAGPAGDAWHIGESISNAETAAPGGEFCFAADRLPLRDAELSRAMEHARFAMEDLTAAAELPDLLLDWLPSGLEVEHADPWAPDPRTIRGILRHALQLEVYYRDGLRDGPAAGIFEAIGTPKTEFELTVAAVARAAHDTARTYSPIRPGRHEPDEWTLRKVMRRLISHHRAHTAEILQRRTWVLLGVPESP